MIRKLPYSLFVVIQVLSATTSRCQADQTVRYNKDIRPILAENCVPCHGPDEANREADLRLDGPDPSFLKSIKSGDPQTSRLIRRIRSTDPDLCMPPPESKKKLNPQQIDLLSKWVAQGAKFENHWAFEPIQDSQPPQTSSKDPSMTDIDRYVNSRLESLGLSMSDPVSRQQLIRRATFDLTGLPPTWDEVQKFVSDPEPDAYARLLDRLLNSPAYGERWGRHWLDLARYADTFGGSAIGFQRFPFSYTYRDYVIRAFNNDLPYDRFIIEQIAADQLDLAENDPALAALGFLTVGMQFRNRNDLVDDQIDVTTRGLMGLTVACARCHDHKYDPIPTTDYYSLYATFERSRPPDQLPLIGPEPSTDQYRNYSHELKKRQVAHDDMARDQSELMRSRLRMQVGLYLKELAKETPEQDLSAAFLSYRTDDIRPLVLNRWRDYLAQMPADDPVFGPWVVLFANRKESPEAFGDRVQKLLSQWKAENGDPKSFQNQNQAGSSSPRWNPMVLDAIESQKPKTLIEVAEAYGNMFAQVNRDWLKATLEASLEAMPGASLIPDEDGRHTTINSAIAQQVRRHLFENATPTAMDRPTATTLLNRTIRDNLNGKNGAVENLNLTSPGSPPRAMSLTETSPEKPYQVFRRGSPLDRGEIVQPRFLTILGENGRPQMFQEGKTRLELARSIVSRENPLLRRVLVNWVWLHHFGQGLVQSADDFGLRTPPPTHPELLDYLAERLVDDQWSIKKLHKRIMLSRVYQQGSVENSRYRQIDPENQALWRMPRHRIDMETMRDSMLAVSGELDLKQTGGRPFELLSRPEVPRRSVYAFINRDIINPLASTFDVANPTSCTVKRPNTIVPQQTLFALNSDFIQDRAKSFANLFQDVKEPKAKIVELYRRALGREPLESELHATLAFVKEADGPELWEQVAHVLLASNEFFFID